MSEKPQENYNIILFKETCSEMKSKQSVNVLRDEKEISGGCFFGNFSVFTNAMRYLVGSIKKSVISMGAFENSC